MRYCLLMPFLLLCLSNTVHCQVPDNYQRLSLGGLKAITLTVAPFEASPDGTSLTSDLVQTDAELRLRKAGIIIVPSKEFGKQIGKVAILEIEIHFLKNKVPDATIYSISVTATQPLFPLRTTKNTPEIIDATTWDNSIFGVVGNDKLSVIRQSTADAVDKFTNDYLAANSK